jgi:hypothetical protein
MDFRDTPFVKTHRTVHLKSVHVSHAPMF